MDALTPEPPRRAAASPAELQAFATRIRQAEVTAPGVPLENIEIPLRMRVNGNSPYLLITSEIRRHLDQAHAVFDLTCRNDLDNGMFTWDLNIEFVMPQSLRKLLDWLVPVYSTER